MTAKISNAIEKQIVEMYTTINDEGNYTGSKTIGRIFDISPTTVNNVLSRNNINRRNAVESHSLGKRCKPIVNVPDPAEIVPQCKCGCGLFVRWNQRKNSWNVFVEGHYRKDALYKNPDWLRQAYGVNHRTIMGIANEFCVNKTVIKRLLNKYKIPTRTTSESLRLNGSMRGDKNPAWNGGVAKWAYAPDWKRIAHDIRKRDNYTCQICLAEFPKSSKILHVHHKDRNKLNNDPSNLVTVCATCHPKGKA